MKFIPSMELIYVYISLVLFKAVKAVFCSLNNLFKFCLLYTSHRLAEFGISVKVIEKSKERCYYLSTHLDDVMVLHGDATDTSLLEEENIDEMDAFVTATGFDEENLLLALMAKQHGIEDVISKVSRESYKDLIEKMGIDMALNPLDIIASTILRYIQGSKKIISSLLIQGQAEIMEIIASDNMQLTNIPLRELELPDGVIIACLLYTSRCV